MPRHRRVLGYARVSSADQPRGSSLSDQQRSITAYAQSNGLTVAHFYVEAESAIHEKIERREQMRALMAEVRAADLVLCDKLDRWSRDPEFTYGSVRKILEAKASFYAVSDRCDPSTPEGDTALGFRILFAREEHKRLKERMVGTRTLLRDRGYYVEGTPPLGYRRPVVKGAAKNVLEVVPSEAETVRRVFRLYVGGRSMNQVARELDLKLDRVKDILHRRVYIGEIENSQGEWIKGHHQPIIDADLFVRAQAVVQARRLGGPRPRGAPSETSDWILRDVARCGACGAKMGAAYAGPKGEGRRHYYRCTKRCGAAFVPVRVVEAEIGPLVVARLDELREQLSRAAAPAPTKAAPDLAAKREKLQRRRERYLDAFADENMTRDELRAALAKLDAKRLKLDAKEPAPSPLAEPAVRRETLRSMKALAHAWKHAQPLEARTIVNALAASVMVTSDGAPSFKWRDVGDLAR
jgi:DNA invertase Pin-like site-specific DNA recombinase